MAHIKKERYEKALEIVEKYKEQERLKLEKFVLPIEKYKKVLNFVKKGYKISDAIKSCDLDVYEFHKALTSAQYNELKSYNQHFKERKSKVKQETIDKIFKEVLDGAHPLGLCKKNDIGIASFYNYLTPEQKKLMKLKEIETII